MSRCIKSYIIKIYFNSIFLFYGLFHDRFILGEVYLLFEIG